MSAVPSNPRLRMSVLAGALMLATTPTFAKAQDIDHSQHHAPPPAEQRTEQDTKSEDHSTMDHSTMDHSTTDHSTTDHSTTDHSTTDHSTTDHSTTDHSTMDHSTMDHSTMDHSTMDHSTMDHSTTDHSTTDHSKRVHGSEEPRTPVPVPTDADRAAAVPPANDHPVHDNPVISYMAFDRLEVWNADPGTGIGWAGEGWVGTDRNRLWLRSEGERVDGHTEGADLEALYGRSIARWWDLVAGVRHDFAPGGSQDFLALGVIGLAPYKFEVSATAYLGESGQSAARLEVEYETLLTNRLILQPLVELSFHGKDDATRGVGSGLSTVEAGLRLRYEITRRFAPYVGVVHERAFARTADFRRMEGESTEDTRVVAGVRIWF